MSVNPCYTEVTQFELSNKLIDSDFFSKIKLSPSARLVLIVLCRYYPKIYPCQKTIAKKSGVSLRGIVDAISELKSKGLILFDVKQQKDKYKFTNIFFELAEVAHGSSRNCIKKDAEIAPNKTNNKIINKSDYFKNKIYNDPKVKKDSSIQKTKEYLKEQANVKTGSPLDYDYEKAVEWYNGLIPELKNSFFAKELKKKYNL